jgi:hypothetical protein
MPNYKELFGDYCELRGYEVLDAMHTANGITAIVQTDDESFVNPKHFTNCYHKPETEKTVAEVRLSFKDFDNQAITDNLIDADDGCSHSDKRICEALGHASYSADGRSGPF